MSSNYAINIVGSHGQDCVIQDNTVIIPDAGQGISIDFNKREFRIVGCEIVGQDARAVRGKTHPLWHRSRVVRAWRAVWWSIACVAVRLSRVQ